MRGIALAFVIGAIAGAAGMYAATSSRETVLQDPALRDSLSASLARLADLDSSIARSKRKAEADSLELARMRSRVRVVAKVTTDTVTVPDTLTVYEVPPPVARLVETLDRRVLSQQVVIDSLTLANVEAKNAQALAESIARNAEGALETEKRRKWRYRLEGASVGGIVVTLAVIVLAL